MTLAKQESITPEIMEKVVIEGDLSKLTPGQRMEYYKTVCDSLGLNPLTKPFSYITFQKKMILYANKDCTEQLAATRKISVGLSDGITVGQSYIAKARASMPDGRFSDATGVVAINGLKGDNLSNALMKAETKASRRAVLRLVGLGWLDETETDTIEGAVTVDVDLSTGEISTPEPKRPPPQRQQANPGPNLARKWPTRDWNAFKAGLKTEWGDDTMQRLVQIMPDGVDVTANSSLQTFVDAEGLKNANEIINWCLDRWDVVQSEQSTPQEPDGDDDDSLDHDNDLKG